MEIPRVAPRIGKQMLNRFIQGGALFSVLFLGSVSWGALSFKASTNPETLSTEQTVSIEDSVQIIFQLESDRDGVQLNGLQANIDPSFELLNEFSTFSSETTQNFQGPPQVRNIQQITRVYKPSRLGTFVFSNIQAQVNGKPISAPRGITIHVVGAQPSGASNASSSGKSSRLGGGALSGMSRNSTKIPIQLRAEVNKTTAYKGEQIIVSYWFYRRVRTAGIQVDQYPTLPGFLREELEMPILSPRQETEQVVIGGVPYTRTLLVRYAAYPLQEGKLRIDPMVLKYQYFAADSMGAGLGQAWEDLGLSDDSIFNFFRRALPKAGQVRSDPVTIESLPLPTGGRPESFTGGVGDFSVNASVSATEVRANEPLTLTLQISGQGNLAAVAVPQTKWPSEFELYDTQSKAKSEKGGRGEKTFEFLLIPRKSGHFKLPSIELSFFDPAAKSYVTRSTPGFEITVQEPLPGASSGGTSKRTHSVEKPSETRASSMGLSDARLAKLSGFALAALAAVLGFWALWRAFGPRGLWAQWRKERRERRGKDSDDQPISSRKEWDQLKKACQRAVRDEPWNEVTAAYELLAGLLFDALDREIKHWSGATPLTLRSRSRSRNDLHSFLVHELKLPEEIWVNFSKILEFSELVRFASSAGAVSEAQARKDLTHWVLEGHRWAQALEAAQQKSR